MFDLDLLITFALMAILFLRQVSILKQANKINYSPLMLTIGAISSLIHFILHPDTSNAILLTRESLIPILVALFLYVFMNILHQTKESQTAKVHDKFTKVLVDEISQLKKFIAELETRMMTTQKDERDYQEEIRTKFKKDITALDTIQLNQTHFLDKFDTMEQLYTSVNEGLENFTTLQLPELDNVVHKHIDILRVAEQDHYNKLNVVLEKAMENRNDMSVDIEELKITLSDMQKVSQNIAKSIVQHTLQQLSGVTKSFETQIVSLKSHTESVQTSLNESDMTLSNIRKQSEMIMKQMILSSNKMNELEKQNGKIYDVSMTLEEMMRDIKSVKSDYIKSQSQLSIMTKELERSQEKQIQDMQFQIDTLSESLAKKIDASLIKLHEHYHIANDDITQSLQVLSKRAKFQKGYAEFDKNES